jgi:3-deoxy-D-manno-octulosonic-acid transferase
MRLIAPLWQKVLNERLKRGKETPLSISQKLMVSPAARPSAPIIWGHAVGVGEALALAGLFNHLADKLPNHHFLITSSARTSAQVLQSGQLPQRCTHQFSPIDTPFAVQSFLRHWQPTMAIWCEMDIWPCLMGYTYQLGIPMLLVNARLSEKSFNKRRYIAWLYQDLLQQFDHIYCQNTPTQQRLCTLGADSKRVTVVGSIKQLAQPLRCDPLELLRLQTAIGQRPCWLLASSHEGEEAIAIKAHALIMEQFPNALLIIAPRYPHRGSQIAQQFHLQQMQRSLGALPTPTASIYLCDTIGEMGLWYRLASIALVGGSLVPVGGHNPYEALQLDCQVLHGLFIEHFSESYESLAAQGLCSFVNDTSQIALSVCKVFADNKKQIPKKENAMLFDFLNYIINFTKV